MSIAFALTFADVVLELTVNGSSVRFPGDTVILGHRGVLDFDKTDWSFAGNTSSHKCARAQLEVPLQGYLLMSLLLPIDDAVSTVIFVLGA